MIMTMRSDYSRVHDHETYREDQEDQPQYDLDQNVVGPERETENTMETQIPDDVFDGNGNLKDPVDL